MSQLYSKSKLKSFFIQNSFKSSKKNYKIIIIHISIILILNFKLSKIYERTLNAYHISITYINFKVSKI